MISKSIMFHIDKCVDPVDKPGHCKKEDEIEKYINEMTAQLWTIESHIDMRYMHG